MIRLKELREAKHYTQSKIAQDLGISRQSYSNYEIGKREPDLATLKKMAEYFNISVDYLVGGNQKQIPKEKIPKDLKRLLKDEDLTLNGRIISEEDKQKIFKILEAAFWEAKEMNRRKK